MKKALILRTFFSLTLCVVIVLYFLYNAHELHPYPVKKVASGIFVQSSVSEPQEKLRSSSRKHSRSHVQKVPISLMPKHRSSTARKNILSSYKYNSSHAHEGTLPPLPTTLPYPSLLKETHEIQKTLWVTQLYQFLQSLNHSISPHVNMVFGDSNHIELVLNWIIAAHVRLDPPLHNIMVISVDQPLCDFLVSKKVPVTCIAVPPQSFLASTGLVSYDQGIKPRLVVLRLINFWGYDVASYDSDAVLLHNPQHYFDSNPDVQLFAGSVKVPWDVSELWGFTISGGTVIVRSHHSTGTQTIVNSCMLRCLYAALLLSARISVPYHFTNIIITTMQ